MKQETFNKAKEIQDRIREINKRIDNLTTAGMHFDGQKIVVLEFRDVSPNCEWSTIVFHKASFDALTEHEFKILKHQKQTLEAQFKAL